MCRGKRNHAELFGILTVVVTLVSGSVGIRIEKVLVPPSVRAGETVKLSCIFDLEGKKLYSLNWWKGSEQFFQFSPNSQEQIVIYDSPGIEIDKDRSGRETVVLRNVSRATAGKFKCEVLADYPSFEKDIESTSMEVIEVPDRPPSVSVTRYQWSPGQSLSANCTSPDARPPPDLHWYINGDKLSPDHSKMLSLGKSQSKSLSSRGKGYSDMTTNEILPSGLTTRTSHLSFVLRDAHFHRSGTAVLTCTAAMQGLYFMSTNVTLTLPGFRSPAPSQKLYGRANTKEGSLWLLLVVTGTAMMLPVMRL